MTPSSLRSALQQRLKDNLQAAHLVGTIRSLGDDAPGHLEGEEEEEEARGENQGEDQKLLPPSIPRHLRRPSREEGKLDKIEIDAENIETPPVTRRAFGMRSFRSPSDSRWLNSGQEESEDIDGRRIGRRFRSLTSEDRRALVGEKKLTSDGESTRRHPRSGVDSSENEGAGSEIEERGTARRSQRFKRLADLAKDIDSETEQMLARQKDRPPSIGDDDGLGDGNFERFSSVRKTLRHKKMQDKVEPKQHEDYAQADSRGASGGVSQVEATCSEGSGKGLLPASSEHTKPCEEESSVEKIQTSIQQAQVNDIAQETYEDKDTRLKRWQRIKETKTEDEERGSSRSREADSWKDRITRRFRSNVDKYDVQRAMEDHRNKNTKGELKPPTSERLHRKNKDTVARGFETRGSFRATGGTADPRRDRRDRTRSAIDPAQVRQALDKEKEKDKKRSVFGDPSRGVGRLFSKLDSKEPSRLRRGEAQTRSLLDTRTRNRVPGSSTTKDVDEGFEDTGSIKSETTSQGASSTGDVPNATLDRVQRTPSSVRKSNPNGLRIESHLGSLRGRPEQSSLGASKKSEKSGSRSSLRSSRSSLTSAASVNTVRPAKPPSKSPSTTSIISNKSDSSNRARGKMNDYTSALKSLTFKSLRMNRGNGENYETTQSSPCSPKGGESQPSFPDDRTRSSGSLHSSGGVTPTRPLSRADSTRSTGSLSKQSSEGSLRRGPIPGTKSSTRITNNNNRNKRPLAPAQVRSLTTNDNRGRNKSGSSGSLRKSPGSTPNSSVKVKRGDSGSSKENLSRSNSGNSRVGGTTRTTRSIASSKPLADRSASFRSSPPKPELGPRRSTGNTLNKSNSPRKGGSLPAFMQPTKSSSSKMNAGDAPPTTTPIKKVKVVSRNITLASPRPMVK